MTKEEFDDIIYDILCEECTDEVHDCMDTYMAEEIIMEYGLQKAIRLMIYNNGPLEDAPSSHNMAYCILEEKTYDCTNFASYTQYINENPL